MNGRLRRMVGVLGSLCFFLVVLGHALVLADGPVRVEVDKGAGRPGSTLNSPVNAPLPGHSTPAPRQVQQATGAQPAGGSWWRTPLSWGRWAVSGLLEAVTGADLDQWMKPEKFWSNLGSGVLSFVTGAGTNEWKDIKHWGFGMWVWVIFSIALTVFTLGGGKLLGKLLGPVGKLALKVVEPLGKLLGGSKVGRTLARWAESSGVIPAVVRYGRQFAEWVLSKGFRKLVKVLDPNPFKNTAVKWIVEKLAETTLGRRLAESWIGRGAKVAVESWHALRGAVGRLVGDNFIAKAIRRIPVGETTLGVLLQRSRAGLKDLLKFVAKMDLIGLVSDLAEKVMGTRWASTVADKALISRLRVGLALKGELDALSKGRKRVIAIIAWAPLAWNAGKRTYAAAAKAAANGIAAAVSSVAALTQRTVDAVNTGLQAAGQAWDAGVAATRRTVEDAKAGIRRGAEATANGLRSATIAVGSAIGGAMEATEKRAGELGRTLRDSADALWDEAVAAGRRTVESAVEGAQRRRTTLADRADKAVTALRGAAVAAARSASEAVSPAKRRAESLGGSARSNSQDILGTGSGTGRRFIQRSSDADSSASRIFAPLPLTTAGAARQVINSSTYGNRALAFTESTLTSSVRAVAFKVRRITKSGSQQLAWGLRRWILRSSDE